AAEGAAVVVSSHLLAQIEALCTRFLVLREGRLLFDGSKAEIAARLPALRDDASLEELFFEATERAPTGGGAGTAACSSCSGARRSAGRARSRAACAARAAPPARSASRSSSPRSAGRAGSAGRTPRRRRPRPTSPPACAAWGRSCCSRSSR